MLARTRSSFFWRRAARSWLIPPIARTDDAPLSGPSHIACNAPGQAVGQDERPVAAHDARRGSSGRCSARRGRGGPAGRWRRRRRPLRRTRHRPSRRTSVSAAPPSPAAARSPRAAGRRTPARGRAHPAAATARPMAAAPEPYDSNGHDRCRISGPEHAARPFTGAAARTSWDSDIVFPPLSRPRTSVAVGEPPGVGQHRLPPLVVRPELGIEALEHARNGMRERAVGERGHLLGADVVHGRARPTEVAHPAAPAPGPRAGDR